MIPFLDWELPYNPVTDAVRGDVVAASDGRVFMYSPDDDEEPGPHPWVASRPGEWGDDGGWWYRAWDIPTGSVLIARDGRPVVRPEAIVGPLLDVAARPVRARLLARVLGVRTSVVQAALLRMQNGGQAASHRRRWTAA